MFNSNINNKIKSKDARTLISNFSYLTLLQMAGYVFPLITIPYLSRVLGASGLGTIAFGAAVTTWFMSFSTWGFNFTATRDAARNRDNTGKLSEIFSNVFWARLILTLICFAVLSLLIIIIPSFKENKLVLYMTFLSIPANIMYPEWMFQALERMKFITILSLVAKTVFTLAIFIFIKSKEDYYLDPLLAAIGNFVAGGIALYFIIGRWKIKLIKPSWSVIFNTIKGSTDVFINNFMPNLYKSMSMVLLGTFHGSVATGLLAAGEKCLGICQQFFNILARTFFPFLSRRADKHSQYAKISIISSFIFSIALFVFADFIISFLYTEEFHDAIALSRIMAFSLVFLALTDVYGTNYMILQGFEQQLRNITMICSIVGLVIAIVLTYFFSYYGAAITILTTRGLTSMITYFYSKRQMRLSQFNKN